MINFSYVWFFTLFILQVMSLGINLAKLGEEKKTKYTLGCVFWTIIVCVLTGLSLYWWR